MDGFTRLRDAASRDPGPEGLYALVDAVSAELRRRVGGTFTLAELAAAYAGAERWSRAVVSEQAPAPGWPRLLSLVEAAAFHEYARPGLRTVSVPARRAPRPRRNPLVRPALLVLGLLALLFLGIAIGRALEDGPSPGGTQTNIRTLQPQPLPPAERTVTVTVTTG